MGSWTRKMKKMKKRGSKPWLPKCDRCGRTLTAPGGLVFSPPQSDIQSLYDTVTKFHICVNCWMDFGPWLLRGPGLALDRREPKALKKARLKYQSDLAAWEEGVTSGN